MQPIQPSGAGEPDRPATDPGAVTLVPGAAGQGGDDVGVRPPGVDQDRDLRDDDWDDDDAQAPRDWAWVEEWRESGEPPAWAPGVALAAFTATVVGLAVLVLSRGLSSMPWLAVSANVVVAAGLSPALWLSRHLPVLRWISAGAAAGVLIGWIGALIS